MEQNLNHWLREVMAGRRPGYALVISGPQGVGKTTLTTQLARITRLPINHYQEAGGRTLHVARDGMERRIDRDTLKAMISAAASTPGGEPPVGVIIETTAPSLFKETADRRFFHIRLGA